VAVFFQTLVVAEQLHAIAEHLRLDLSSSAF